MKFYLPKLFLLTMFFLANSLNAQITTTDCVAVIYSDQIISSDEDVEACDVLLENVELSNNAILNINACNRVTFNPDVNISLGTTLSVYITEDCGTNNSGTPISAFDEFNSESVTFSFDDDEVTIESTGVPNHTSPYWGSESEFYVEQTVGDHLTPGIIRDRSYTVTVSLSPELAASSSSTGLGAIGISVTGAPIFNDQEGPNRPLDVNTALGFDYAGGHNGPSGYHYHIESFDVPENTTLSFDDEQLIGILADGFLLYGRKCNAIGDHPTDLDESGGHISSTQHSDGNEFYHYHIINEYYIDPYIILFGGDLQGTPNAIF